jgi:hypothetical protein
MIKRIVGQDKALPFLANASACNASLMQTYKLINFIGAHGAPYNYKRFEIVICHREHRAHRGFSRE